jgi:hypothetical protein
MTPELQASGVRYSGTKTLTAWPMTRGAYNDYRTWTPPAGEDQTTAGYLVEYADGGAPNDSRHAGYISWSPADVFEKSYRRIETFEDRLAIERDELAQRGAKLAEYLTSAAFAERTPRQQEKLRAQFTAMTDYLEVLVERIGDLSVQGQPPADNAHVAPGCEQFPGPGDEPTLAEPLV